jgi:hypothetical protein
VTQRQPDEAADGEHYHGRAEQQFMEQSVQHEFMKSMGVRTVPPRH